MGQVELERLPAKTRKKLPLYPLPVLRLARLAVDDPAARQGIGFELLRFVLELAVDQAARFGCIGSLVDAYPAAVAFYARFGFEHVATTEGSLQTRPRTSEMFLAIATVKASLPKRG